MCIVILCTAVVVVACSVGTYYDGVMERCVQCQAGMYQDQEGKLSCKECPHRQPGMGVTGAKNTAECTGNSITKCGLEVFVSLKTQVKDDVNQIK